MNPAHLLPLHTPIPRSEVVRMLHGCYSAAALKHARQTLSTAPEHLHTSGCGVGADGWGLYLAVASGTVQCQRRYAQCFMLPVHVTKALADGFVYLASRCQTPEIKLLAAFRSRWVGCQFL